MKSSSNLISIQISIIIGNYLKSYVFRSYQSNRKRDIFIFIHFLLAKIEFLHYLEHWNFGMEILNESFRNKNVLEIKHLDIHLLCYGL